MFSHFSTFRATIQKVAFFAKKVALFDFSGNVLTFRLFRQKFKKSNFSQEVALFDIYLSPFPARNIGYGWIWDMQPTRQYLSIRPVSRRYRIWDYWILPHVSIYLSPFQPEKNLIWEYWMLPHVSIYLSPFPARKIGYGICPTSVSLYPPFQPEI